MTAELLSQERAKALLMAYGAEPERWPPEWREPLILALANDPVLQEYAAVEARLDQAMVAESVDLPITVASVLAFTDRATAQDSNEQTEAGLGGLERFIEWLCFSGARSAWRGVAVASLSLALGVALGLGVVTPAEDEWVASEQYVFALVVEG
ncbi:hypothetical protein N9C27_03375 [Luminiphilus sp.]|nr:hypothetical protein [Luminiphilus sp.]